MNAVIAFALRQRVLMVLLLLFMFGVGIVSFLKLNIEAYPDPVPPLVDINTLNPGQSAEEIERYHSGRVIKLIAKLGDHVEAGATLFEIQATEFVQAQNDLITALANLQTARSQLAQAQTNEKRAHDLYLAQGGALKDWQQAQTDLITSQNTVRADEIALAAVRNRLRILQAHKRAMGGVQDRAG